MKLTLAQEKALRLVAAGYNDCETTATQVTRALRTKGLLAFGEVNGRVAYVLTGEGQETLKQRGER